VHSNQPQILGVDNRTSHTLTAELNKQTCLCKQQQNR